MSREVLIAVLVTLIVEESTGLSRWIAARMGQWAAKHIYLYDSERAKTRSEEWEALISKSIPANITALTFGLSLASAAVACILARRIAVAASSFRQVCVAPAGMSVTDRDKRHVSDARQASFALFSAACELRLLAIEPLPFNPDLMQGRLKEIRARAVDTELRAADVALAAPDTLATPAGQLADVARRLAEAAQNLGCDDGQIIDHLSCAELDETTNVFLRSAVAMFRDLGDHDPGPASD